MSDPNWLEPPDGSVFAGADVSLSILLYLDSETEFKQGGFLPERLGAVLRANGARVDILARPVTLDRTLLDQYHEVWFILASRAAKDELTAEECSVLREWMDRGGGVLLTGDHAENIAAAGEPVRLEGVGRAIGLMVPRARHMRLWDAPPDADGDAFDTTEILVDRRGPPRKREGDATSQRLLLPLLDGRDPHPIFHGPEDSLLDRWPDHRHEGRVVVPERMDDEAWLGTDRKPEIVARSVDWRRGACFDVMAVWDGQALPPRADGSAAPTCGRIVADSSWHHYVDYNLDGIVSAGDGPGSDWAKIQGLYVNLAAWLAPAAIRRRFRELACAWVSRQIAFEVKGLIDRQIGESTRRLLAARLPAAWRQEVDRDMLVDAVSTAGAAVMPREFADVLMGAYMRRYVTGDAMDPVWRSAHMKREPQGAARRGLVAEAIASYEDELWQRREQLERFRSSLQ